MNEAAKGAILIVDDNRMNRLKLSHSLEQQGHTVAVAENGREGLEMMRARSFDLVLLDILMPEMDGHRVLAEMKSDPTLRDLPVIVISAVDEIESIVQCIERGAVDYLTKPFDPVLLKARLSASLEKKRLRDLERAYLQQEMMLRQSEKLATLGKLSAGLAHELNNPASAVQRGAGQIAAVLERRQELEMRLGALQLSPAQREALARGEERATARAGQPDDLDALAASDQEQAIEAWLEARSVEDAWECAPALVRLGYRREELEELAGTFAPDHLGAVFAWLAATYTVHSLLAEIEQGAGRIAELVKALKSYTYLDQAPVQSVRVHEGIDDTLVMLRNKLKQGVRVHRDYADGLPAVQGHGSELNQVWTNLIDNAVDAMGGRGELRIRTRHEPPWVVVEIEDDGPGIPEEIQPRIFDPFFTTKPPGHGAGLGLNITHNIIVQKHRGGIRVDSRPGRTRFEIRLPVETEARQPGGRA